MWAPPTSTDHTTSGLAAWILAMTGAKLLTSSGEELDRHILAAGLADHLLHPFRGDLAVVVVGGQDVALLLALLLHDVVDQRLELLRRHHAGGDVAPVADAALIERVVEQQAAELAHHRPHHLARGAGDAAMDHLHLVLRQRLRGVLRVELVVRLGIVEMQLERPAQEAAGGIDLVDRHGDALICFRL